MHPVWAKSISQLGLDQMHPLSNKVPAIIQG